MFKLIELIKLIIITISMTSIALTLMMTLHMGLRVCRVPEEVEKELCWVIRCVLIHLQRRGRKDMVVVTIVIIMITNKPPLMFQP